MTNTFPWFASRLSLLLVGVAACAPGPSSFAEHPGDSVLVRSATSAKVESAGGGLTLPLPPDGACDPEKWSYEVDLSSGKLTWDRCDVTQPKAGLADYTPSSGVRTVSSSELATAKHDLAAVHVSNRTTCGADKASVSLTIQADDGTMPYGDDFYACTMEYAHYVESDPLDAFAASLGHLVTPSSSP